MKRLLLLTAAALLAACSPAKPEKPQPAFDTSLPMIEVMVHDVDPAAFLVWNASGEVISEAGVQSRVPTTDEGWKSAEDGAVQLIAAGNLLMLPGYARDGDWSKYAAQLTETGELAKAAVEAKDGQKLFDAGAQIYVVCTACHEKYLVEPEMPASAAAPAGK